MENIGNDFLLPEKVSFSLDEIADDICFNSNSVWTFIIAHFLVSERMRRKEMKKWQNRGNFSISSLRMTDE